jgi:hypothetical protein
MQKYEKYVEVLDIYSDTYEPTEMYIPITRCPSVITNMPTIQNTSYPNTSYPNIYPNKSNQENMILIIVLPTVFSVIVLLYITYKMYCLKYRININRRLDENRKLDENFGTEFSNTIDF